MYVCVCVCQYCVCECANTHRDTYRHSPTNAHAHIHAQLNTSVCDCAHAHTYAQRCIPAPTLQQMQCNRNMISVLRRAFSPTYTSYETYAPSGHRLSSCLNFATAVWGYMNMLLCMCHMGIICNHDKLLALQPSSSGNGR